MTPTITAIIPTHNRTRLLATTLRTVLWQRDVALEVIVVDDGSSEDVARVVAHMADPRVRMIRHDRPMGVSNARNRGAAEARAAWLAFCDDDDLWAPDKLAAQLSAAHAADCTWAYGGAVHVNLELRLLTAKPPPPPAEMVETVARWNIMPGGSSNVIVRADAFAAAGSWDPALINLADWDLWARLAQRGIPASVAAPLVGYRIHQGNASADTDLILREARLIDGRYGAALDYGELHHYLAWVHLRAGRRRAALPHLARAAAHGEVAGVARTVCGVALRRVMGVTRRRDDPVARLWLAQTEAWVATLRAAPSNAA